MEPIMSQKFGAIFEQPRFYSAIGNVGNGTKGLETLLKTEKSEKIKKSEKNKTFFQKPLDK